MKTISLFFAIILLLNILGCDDHRDRIIEYDTTPPLPPVGIRTISLDNSVEIRWIDNQETDISGYKIYVSNSFNGRYDLLGSSSKTSFVDRGARNGITYFYAVTAYDFSGNESELSRDVVYDTPRPEGFNVLLQNRYVSPNTSGYDFSAYSIVNYDTDMTDFYVEFTQKGIPYFVVWEDSDIQDMGFSIDLDEITSAPTEGWSPTKDAHLILGHTYVIHTWDNHYAKIRVKDIRTNTVQFDWAYQTSKGNTELRPMNASPTRHRKSLTSPATK